MCHHALHDLDYFFLPGAVLLDPPNVQVHGQIKWATLQREMVGSNAAKAKGEGRVAGAFRARPGQSANALAKLQVVISKNSKGERGNPRNSTRAPRWEQSTLQPQGAFLVPSTVR